jgi:hypothetical protein
VTNVTAEMEIVAENRKNTAAVQAAALGILSYTTKAHADRHAQLRRSAHGMAASADGSTCTGV